MAILKGDGSKMKGSTGGLNYYQMNGKTIVRQKRYANNQSHKTEYQAKTQCSWGNIVSVWRAFEREYRPYFELKADGQRDYNQFIAANKEKVNVYLTKDQGENHFCVAAPYIITQGSLPSIGVRELNGLQVTDILLGDFEITPETPIRDFAHRVCMLNEDFNYGDEILFIRGNQRATGANCRLDMSYMLVTLNERDNRSMFPEREGSEGFRNIQGYLGCGEKVDGVVAWVHRRNGGERMQVSSQKLVCTSELYSEFSSDEQMLEAVASHKPKAPRFDSLADDVKREREQKQINQDQNDTQVKIIASALPGEGGMVMGGGSYTKGGTVSLMAMANVGYTFKGWNDGETLPMRTIVALEETAYTALFEKAAD